MEYVFFYEKIILSQSNSFLQVFKISPLSPVKIHDLVCGEIWVKYGNLEKCLEIT